ncbi:Nuclease S1 [Hordeum vulgare]|nr:Nuclease S1 [Hordeum vulgare]
MGDIYQPLHVGFTSDKGGNTIDVHWYRRKTELHHMAEKDYYNKDAGKFVDALNESIKGALLFPQCVITSAVNFMGKFVLKGFQSLTYLLSELIAEALFIDRLESTKERSTHIIYFWKVCNVLLG